MISAYWTKQIYELFLYIAFTASEIVLEFYAKVVSLQLALALRLSMMERVKWGIQLVFLAELEL